MDIETILLTYPEAFTPEEWDKLTVIREVPLQFILAHPDKFNLNILGQKRGITVAEIVQLVNEGYYIDSRDLYCNVTFSGDMMIELFQSNLCTPPIQFDINRIIQSKFTSLENIKKYSHLFTDKLTRYWALTWHPTLEMIDLMFPNGPTVTAIQRVLSASPEEAVIRRYRNFDTRKFGVRNIHPDVIIELGLDLEWMKDLDQNPWLTMDSYIRIGQIDSWIIRNKNIRMLDLCRYTVRLNWIVFENLNITPEYVLVNTGEPNITEYTHMISKHMDRDMIPLYPEYFRFCGDPDSPVCWLKVYLFRVKL